ncbi:hypothetical protein [Thiohalorhabdus sp.]|uniref:hypothetical protein n=1 Tax=Thiohalorhabdus sp. TaxID=3094134 RepID=UPI002FC3C338
MAINEHWGTGFEVNRDPNAAVRKDTVPENQITATTTTGKVGAYSGEVHTNRPLTHEITLGGVLGIGGTHLYVPRQAEIRFLDGRRGQLEEIRKGDAVAAIYQEVAPNHKEESAKGPGKRLEAIQLLVARNRAQGTEG